jgi:glyoxylate reductase
LSSRVLVSPDIPQDWLAPLELAGHELVVLPPDDRGHHGLVAAAGGADGILTTLTERIDAEVLEAGAAGRLRVVANVAVGVDNIDIRRAAQLGVAVCNTPGVLDAATADIAMLLVLSACRLASDAERVLRAAQWHGWQLTGFLGKDLEGARLGLVGYGGIGRAVEGRALGFGMQVAHHARHSTGLPGYVGDLGELLGASDVVSVHVPLTAETTGLINAERIARMPRGAVLVNTARGAVVDEEALVEALESGHLGAAGLDVFVGEPHASPRLLRAPHLVLLPHIGSATFGARRRMTELACNGICEVLAGRQPPNLVAAT